MSYKVRKVLRAFAKHGFVVLREGASHTMIRRESDGIQIVVPRHVELNRFTVRGMVNDAGLDWNAFKRDVS